MSIGTTNNTNSSPAAATSQKRPESANEILPHKQRVERIVLEVAAANEAKGRKRLEDIANGNDTHTTIDLFDQNDNESTQNGNEQDRTKL